MKKLLFSLILLLCLGVTGWGQVYLINETFASAGAVSSGWTFNSIGVWNGQPCDGTYCMTYNASGDYGITPLLTTPGMLTFSKKRSSNTTAWAMKVQQSSSLSGPWTDIATITSISATCATEPEIDLSSYSNVYLKLIDTRASGTHERSIDLILITTKEPTSQTSSITFPTVGTTSMSINWTNGNGGRRAVFMKEGSGSITNPTDGVGYTASADWSSKGTQLGTSGYYCIYNGTGASLDLTNLVPGTTYYVQAFEYNCDNNSTPTASTINYFTSTATDNPNNQSTTAGSDPIKLVITSISPSIPTAGNSFSVTIQAQDGSNNPANVTSATDISLSKATGSGTLGGTTTGQIANGSNSVVISGVTYSMGETGVSITAATTGGMSLTSGTSSTFTVLATQPSTASSGMVFGTQTTTEIPLTSWTVGNGANRIVVRRAGGSATAPTNGTDYAVSSSLGTGTVIYNGSSNTVTASSLTAGTQYSFDIYEYNGSGATANYGSVYTASRYTLQTEPSSHSATFSSSSVSTTTLTLNFTTTGTSGLGYIILRKEGASSSTGTPVDGTNYVVGDALGDGVIAGFVTANSTTTAAISGLTAATQYTFSIIPFGRVSANNETYNYYTGGSIPTLTVNTLATAPTTTSSAMVFGTQTTTEIPLTSWTIGNGANRIVVRRAGGSATAPTNGTDYTVSSSLGTGTVIYNGSSNTVTASSLTAGTQYSFDIYEYNGSGATANYGSVYTASRYTLQTEPSSHTASLSASSLAPTSLTLNFTTTSATLGYLIVRKDGASAFSGTPVDGTGYVAGNTIGDGTVAAVVTTTTTTAAISGLTAAIQYTFSIIPFGRNGTNAESYNYYIGGSIPTLTVYTLATAPTAATSIVIGTRTASSINISWTNGTGANRIVVARLNASSAIAPANATSYTPVSTSFSDGSNPTTGTGNVVVYNGTGNSTIITGLVSSTSYKFDVYEYNGSSTTSNYSSALTPASATSTLYAEPTVQTTSVVFSAIGATQMTISFTKGDASNRIVLVKSGSAVNSDPVDATAYTASATFASGTQIGTGNYVVYNGTGTSVTVSGLTANTTYYVAVYEFGGSGANTNYLLTSPATGNQITLVAVPSAPSSLTFSSVSYNSFTSSFSAPVSAPAGYIVLRRTGSAVTGTPVGGTVYTQGQTNIGSGVNEVVYLGTSVWSNYSQTGLTDNTAYYYAVYSYDGTGTQTNYSVVLSGSQTTSSVSTPTANSASSITTTSFDANWSEVGGAVNYKLDVATSSDFTSITTIASEGFENASPLFPSPSGGSYYSGNSGTGDLPASSPFAVAGTYSYGISSGTSILTSSDLNTSNYTDVYLNFRLASFSVNSAGNGAEANDIVTVEISPDGGANYYSTIRVKGGGNSCWAYLTGTGIASTNYDGDVNAIDFSPLSGGNRTTDGYSTVTVTGLPSVSNLKIRITMVNDATNERWVIDDLSIKGNFGHYVSGYNNLSVSSTIKSVTGLTPNETYYYRVRSVGGNSTSANSGTITVATTAAIASNYSGTGNWSEGANWSAGKPGAITDVIVNGSLTIDDLVDCNNITIPYNGSVTVGSGQGLSVNGNLLIESTASGTGSFISASDDYTVTGTSTVQRYVHAATWTDWKDGWHALSSPVSAQAVSGFTEATAADYDIYSWYEPGNVWVNYKNTDVAPTWNTANTITNGLSNNAANFLVGKGYLVSYKNNVTKSFVGNLNTSDVSITGLDISGAGSNSFHLLGNPFPSAILWDAGWTKSNIAATAQVWSEALQDYASVVYGDFIPSMNGFIVEATSDGASLTIPAAKRAHNATSWYKNQTANLQSLKLTILAADGGSGKETIIRFDPMSTTAFDKEFDGSYLQGYGPVFYSNAGDLQLSVNTLPSLTNNTEIPLTFVRNQATDFELLAEGLETIPADVYLNDLKTGTSQNLRLNPVYSFNSSDSDSPDRFKLTFGAVGIGESENQNSLQAYVYGNRVYVTNTLGKAMMQLFDLQGRLVQSSQLNGDGLQSQALNLPAGVYVLRLSNAHSVKSEKVVVGE